MISRRPTTRPGPAFTVIAVFVATVAGFFASASARAADGPQSPPPTLNPSPVATAATTFDLSNGTCDGTGAAGWRVQTFIVNSGVDLSTLDFVSGVGSDQVGTDRNNTDGSISSPLFKGNVVGTGYNPAASPAGLINPADLSAFSFSSAGWTLTDGTYQIGYACLDELSVLRQWWAVTVTIDVDASPNAFLTVGGGTGTTTTSSTTTTTTGNGGSTTTTTAGGSTTTTTSSGGTTTTTLGPGSTTTVTGGAGSTTSTSRGSSVLSSGSNQGTGSGSLAATGQGLAVAGIGLVLIYLGRVAFLLAQPRRSANGR